MNAQKNFSVCFMALLVFFMFQTDVFSSCEEDCEVTKSCKEYIECRAAHLNCLAACREKQAWEVSERASEKMIISQEKMAGVYEKTSEVLERVIALLDKIISKLDEKDETDKKELLPAGQIPAN